MTSTIKFAATEVRFDGGTVSGYIDPTLGLSDVVSAEKAPAFHTPTHTHRANRWLLQNYFGEHGEYGFEVSENFATRITDESALIVSVQPQD